MTETLEHISIFWTHDSDELMAMFRELGDPGMTIGNDGAEVAVNAQEYDAIMDYAAEHPEITVKHKGQIARADAELEAKNWK